MLKLSEIKRVHFIGIGGISLSSLALFLRARNIGVSGSDRIYGNKFPVLIESDCDVWVGCCPEKVGTPSLVVYSGAIAPDNEELLYCKAAGIPCMERFLFLGELSASFRYTVAVAGTHGKTTVTAMLAHVFKTLNQSCYAHIGGDLAGVGNCYYSGDEYFITEACEYRKSLLSLRPDIGIVLNAETDHPDTYNGLSDVYDTFDTFLDGARRKGIALTDGDCHYYSARQTHSRCMTVGKNSFNDYVVEKIIEHKNGCYGFSISKLGIPIADIKLNIVGEHNVMNAAFCFAVCDLLHFPNEAVGTALFCYDGVKRRFEKAGYYRGAAVYSDYAHHPSEIRAAIKTARALLAGKGKLFTVFQPHTYSRTAKLFDDFLNCFNGTDTLIVAKEYAARENPSCGVDAKTLWKSVNITDKYYFDTVLDINCHLYDHAGAGDLILILGAGDIDTLTDILTFCEDNDE